MDYSKGIGVGGTAAATLPSTGMGVGMIWLIIAAIALVGAGMCLLRFIPKKEN